MGAVCSRQPARSTQGQVERHRGIGAGRKAVVLVKRPCIFIFSVNQQSKSAHQFARLQASVDGTSDQQPAQAPALAVGVTGQPTDSKARHRIARQFFSVNCAELRSIDLSGAKGVEAENYAWLGVIDQYINRTDAFCTLLRREPMQVVVQLWHTAVKARAVMQRGVKNLLFKHA